jgi:hypothetical protein
MMRLSHWTLLALLLMLPLSFAAAQPPLPAPVTHYPLTDGSGDTAADVAGQTTARLGGAVWVRQGDRVALDFDGMTNALECGDPPAAHISSGSLSFAVCFRTNSRAQQYVLTHYGWSLYLDPAGTPNFETRANGNMGWENLAGKAPVALNEWTQVVCVYDEAQQQARLYVNGALQSQGPKPPGFGGIGRSKLLLGAWTGAHYFNGLIGDTRIFNVALSDAQVQALWEQTGSRYPADLRSPLRRLSLRQHRFTASHTLGIDIAFRNLGEPLTDAGAKVELVREGQAQPSASQTVALSADGRGELSFDAATLPVGNYQVRATVTAAGQPLANSTIAAGWAKPAKPPWWVGSAEGNTDKVLAPWTPVQATCSPASASLKCCGREYRFTATALPSNITTAGRDVLAGPVRLVARTDQGEVKWAPAQLKLARQSPTAAVLSVSGSAAGLALSGQIRLEYDGMMRVDLKLVPRAPVRLERLALEIPVKSAHAKYYYYYPDRAGLWQAHRPGAVPAAGVTMPFNPTIWLGDEERGLEWFCESEENWLPADAKASVQIKPQGDITLLKLDLIGQPLALDPNAKNLLVGNGQPVGQLTYTWGLQATPIKSMDPDAWDLRSTTLFAGVYTAMDPGPDGKSQLDLMQDNGVKSLSLMDWTGILCWNQATEPEKLRRFVQECHRRGIQVMVYFGFQVSDAAPEFDQYLEDAANWFEPRPYAYDFGLDNYPPQPVQTVYRVCYRSLWQDFVVAGAAKLMDDYGIDGVYCDGTTIPLQCYNTHHGCGYHDGQGNWKPTYTIFASHVFARRLYSAIRTRNPQGQVNLHNSAFMVAPSIGWATSLWDGEHLYAPGMTMIERLPLDMFRAEFMGRNWGVPQEFLEYSLPGDFRQKWGLTLLHDVPSRPYGTAEQLPYASAIWRLMDRFGRKQATWHPYWANADLVTVEPAEVYVSLYKHPQNGVLLVVDNLGRQEAAVRLKLNTQKLGLTAQATAEDGISGEKLPLQGGALQFTLPSTGWRAVWVRQ